MGAQVAFPERSIRAAPIARPVLGSQARRWVTSGVLAAADVLGIFLARTVAVVLLKWIHPAIGLTNFLGYWQSLGIFAVTYVALGLYAGGVFGAVEELRRVVAGTGFVCLVLTASLFFLQHTGPYSRGLVILSGCLTATVVPLSRASARHVFASCGWWGTPVIVLGAADTAAILITRLHRHPEMGLRPVACLDDDVETTGDCEGVPVAGPLRMAPALAKALKIRHALVAMPGVGREDLVWMLDDWGTVFRHVILIPDLFGIASLWVSARDLGGVLVLLR